MRKTTMSGGQKCVGQEMRRLRSITGLSGVKFASIIGLNSGVLASHEVIRTPWPQERARKALDRLKGHLELGMQEVGIVAGRIGQHFNGRTLDAVEQQSLSCQGRAERGINER
jgi:hypothetical protein